MDSLFRTLISRGTHPTTISSVAHFKLTVIDLQLRAAGNGWSDWNIHPRLEVFAGVPLRPRGCPQRFVWRDLMPGIAIWHYRGHLHCALTILGCGLWAQCSWSKPDRTRMQPTSGPLITDAIVKHDQELGRYDEDTTNPLTK